MKLRVKLSLSFVIIVAVVLFTACGSKMRGVNESGTGNANMIEGIDYNGIQVFFRASGDFFYLNGGDSGMGKTDGSWSRQVLKGVNMGISLATTDLANPNVDYNTYMNWFKQISDMNANTIKVFTIMNPNFYKAFYDYNNKADKPLYLLQGIWFNEDYLYDVGDALDEEEIVRNAFTKSIKETIDIIHGNSDYTDYGEIKNAVYDKDISKYVTGYILGLEWPADFVVTTNGHTDYSRYNGKYLENTEEATPFESFLCEMGDGLIEYETEIYNTQVPVAFLNWQTTDSIKHSNEPFEEEDAVSVNTENIKATDKYYAGLFAAMDIYPYYPEFMNHQKEYVEYKDSDGKSNPYEAYLKDLKKTYSVPVIVAEVGLSTARGVAHESVMGYSQGGLTEKQQGEYICNMLKSIYGSNYAGAMIFSWQEEWFKQTWNTVKYAPENADQRTPNVMSAEQGYGILAVEPGNTQVCKIDGKTDDWTDNNIVEKSNQYTLYSQYDEGYLYLALKLNNKKIEDNSKIYIPISTLGVGSSEAKKEDIKFNKNTDFLLKVVPNGEVRLMSDAYYAIFPYMYGKQKGIFQYNEDYSKKNSGRYINIESFISNEMYLPDEDETIEPKSYESGLLKKGITNPDNISFDNTADYYISDNVLEVRIPWYLLNVMNITEGSVVNDFYNAGEIGFTGIKEIFCGVGFDTGRINLKNIKYSVKKYSNYHTRLKKSYSIIKDLFDNIK